MNIYEALMNIQNELVAPKGQFNSFGKYHYRSCEDILEALKPLLFKYKATLTITDEIVAIGEHSPLLYSEEVYDIKTKTTKEETRVTGSQRYYVKATAKLNLIEDGSVVYSTALAREEENKKGMDSSQLTGSTSSYARKYALNGLFAIDDTKDSDTTNTHSKEVVEPKKEEPSDTSTNTKSSALTDKQISRLYALGKVAGYDAETVKSHVNVRYKKDANDLTKTEYDAVCKGYEGLKK